MEGCVGLKHMGGGRGRDPRLFFGLKSLFSSLGLLFNTRQTKQGLHK